MIRGAADAITFAFSVSRYRREVGLKRGTDSSIENRRTVLGAEDNVNKQV